MGEQENMRATAKLRRNRRTQKQNGAQPPPLPLPSNEDTKAWKEYWKVQDQPWRTGPEIDAERQAFLAERRSITPDIEQGIYPFKDIKLSRADVEWLLATHESGGICGPVDLSDERQRERKGLDLRGAHLEGEGLNHLPLARLRGGLTSQELVRATKEQGDMAVVRLQKANLYRANLQQAHLEGANFQQVNLSETNFQQAHFFEANFQEAHSVGTNFQQADLIGTNFQQAHFFDANFQEAHLERANFQQAHLEGANFQQAHLSLVNFQQAHLEGANFQQAQLSILTDVINWYGKREAHISRLAKVQNRLAKQEAHLSLVNFQQAHLEGANFQQACLSEANLQEADLSDANLQEANLSEANLQEANLFRANLRQADLVGTNLRQANLLEANLRQADLSLANLQEANLSRTQLKDADLEGVTLGNEKQVGPQFADSQWDEVNLAVIKWSQVKILGDEYHARQTKEVDDYEVAVRANRQLATLLRDKGLNEVADRFAYHAQMLQRKVFWKEKKSGQYLFSLFLALLAGYGYKPWRAFLAYLLVIIAFATAYFFIGHAIGPALSPLGSVVFSMTSFHGRGFFPGSTISLDDPLTVLAALEAFVGLLIEVTFIATLTQRLFSK